MLSNFGIIYKFIKATLKNTHGGTESTSRALSKSATMLLTVSFAFIILTGPISLIHIWTEVPVLAVDITVVLQYLNHGINRILYCVTGSRFRNELKRLFICAKENHQRPSRTTLSALSSTNSAANLESI